MRRAQKAISQHNGKDLETPNPSKRWADLEFQGGKVRRRATGAIELPHQWKMAGTNADCVLRQPLVGQKTLEKPENLTKSRNQRSIITPQQSKRYAEKVFLFDREPYISLL